MRLKNIIITGVVLFSQLMFSQTGTIGNYEVYSRKTSMSSLGYYTISTLLPHNLGRMPLKGVLFSYKYILKDLGSVPIGTENEIRVFLEGNFDIGGGLAQSRLLSEYPSFESGEVNYYAGTLNLFSIDITPEYTFIFSDGRALTTKLGFNFFNVGGTIVATDQKDFANNMLGSIDMMPLSIKPSMYFDFGRSGIGLSFLLNPTNFLTYIFSSDKNYTRKQKGLRGFDQTFKKYSFQVLYTF